jgi:hypothetical protein
MNFSEALELLKDGQRLTRAAWERRSRWICLVHAEEWEAENGGSPARATADAVTHCVSWIGLRLQDGTFGPWSPTHADLLANDWESVEVYYELVAPGSDRPIAIRVGDPVEHVNAEQRAALGRGSVVDIVDNRVLRVRWRRQKDVATANKSEVCLMLG